MRLLSLAPSHTEIVFALGAGERLCGVSGYCDHPAEALRLPRLPGWSNIKAADVLAMKPDLVLTSSVCQERLRRELAEAGVPLRHFDPRRLDEVAASFVELGGLLGLESRGRALAGEFQAGFASLRQSAAGKPRPRVYVEEWDKPPMAAGNWVPELVMAAGGEPFHRRLGELSAGISWEELMEFDPEIVVYSICGLGLNFDPSAFLRTEGWNDLAAARSRSLFTLHDSLFNRPGPRLLEGARLLQQLVAERAWDVPPIESPLVRRLRKD